MASGPTFYAFNEETLNVVLKGPFGSFYKLNTTSDVLAPFSHGCVVRRRNADDSRVASVLGELSGQLWIQYKGSHAATSMEITDARRELEAAPLSALGDLEFEGPLGVSYRFDTEALDDQFDVRSGSQHYIKLWRATVSFVGVFLDIPWVRILHGGPVSLNKGVNCAVPLPGCRDGDVLRSLYGLCEVPTSAGAPTIESPRTKMTPRAAAAATAFKVVELKQKAICQAPLGVVLEVNISIAALKPFDLHHGDRLLMLRGVGSGRLATVVGVHSGTLVVHVDGDAKVTIVRGCTAASHVLEHFSRPKGGANRATSQPQASPQPAAADRRLAAPKDRGAPTQVDATPLPSKHSKSKPFRCWTAFGRYEFDTSDATISAFGPLMHEQTVRCTVGAEAGRLFHIVGVRTGTLWVIGEGKTRAIPLTHCSNEACVKKQYGFVACGRTSLKEHDARVDEPPPTPFNSPRGGSRARSAGREDRAGDMATPASKSGQFVPPIVGMNLTRELAPAFTEVATSPPPKQEQERRGTSVGSEHTSSKPKGIDVESLSASPPMIGGSGQSARNYLKAVAMFMLGTTNEHRTPLPFHEYYAVDPTRRLGAALRKLEGTRESWARIHPTKPFADATVEDILRLFAKFPQLLP